MLRDSDSRIFSIFKPESVCQLLAEHQSGKHDRYKLLFSLVMLEQWLRGITPLPNEPMREPALAV